MAGMLLPRKRVMGLDVANIESYLATHGWERDPELSSPEAGIYHLPADPEVEVVLPRDKSLADYALRVSDVLQAVAVAERRTAWEVLDQFSPRQADGRPNGGSGRQSEDGQGRCNRVGQEGAALIHAAVVHTRS